jgi:protein-S-isoprenylcysteine O-methyltransferase Ste14
MKINLRKIIKASIAGIAAGSFFMIIIPSFLIIINLTYDFFIIKNDILFYLGLLSIIIPIFYFWYCTGLFSIFGSGTPAPIEPPKNLVFEVIYKHSRNPMYLCYFLIILGEFFVLGYVLLFYYFLFIVLFINVYVVYFEEPVLVKRFGNDYLDYKKRIPRWFIR